MGVKGVQVSKHLEVPAGQGFMPLLLFPPSCSNARLPYVQVEELYALDKESLEQMRWVAKTNASSLI